MKVKITCFCVLAMIARTLAESGEKACCTPGQYLSLYKVKGKAVCYSLDSNNTVPASLYCEYYYKPFLYENFVFKDGKVDLVHTDGTIFSDVTNAYCVNNAYQKSKNISTKFGIVCAYPASVKISAYTLIVSVVFLILTVIIYAAISELRDLYGKSFINLCGSVAIGFCILANIAFMRADFGDMNLCAAKGFLAYFFLLVSFFWTTAISIQLLLNIRSPIQVVNNVWKTFAWYSLFAWGCPAVITICMAIVNFHPGDHAKPGIGIRSCWFDEVEKPQIWYWLYSVLAILLTINIIIFTYVSFFFCRSKFTSSHTSNLKYKFSLTLRLFVVMGLYWIIELASQIDQGDSFVWTILSIVTSLHGLWIFLAWVVFRKRVIKAMHRRGWLPCFSGFVENHLQNDAEDDNGTVVHTSVPMHEH